MKMTTETMTNRAPYQRLKSDLLSLLYDDEESLFYYLHQKRLHQKKNRKNAIISILKELGKTVNFHDIVRHLIEKDDIDNLIELIIGEKASSSKKAILCGYDSCLKCGRDTPCSKTISSLDSADKVNYLMYMRFIKAKKALRMLKWGNSVSCFNILVREPLLMKFIANYALVVDIKNELKKEGAIADHKTLYKGAGMYCPFDDLWQQA